MYRRFRLPPFLLTLVFGGLCALLAPSATLAVDRIVDQDDVYDIWMDWIEENEPWVADYMHSASDIWEHYGHEGLRPCVVREGYLTVSGQCSTSNGLCWIGGYPLAYDGDNSSSSLADIHFRFSPEEFADYITTPNVSRLVSSVYSTFVGQGNLNAAQLDYVFADAFSSNLLAGVFFPLPGGGHSSAVRMQWKNAPYGFIGAEVRQSPTWYGSLQDLYITPLTYLEITGQWPSTVEDAPVLCPSQRELGDLLDRVNIRVLERWREQ